MESFNYPFWAGLATYLTLTFIIYRSFEKIQDNLTDASKETIANWLLELKIPSPPKERNWSNTFIKLFDQTFGKKHFTIKCFIRSSYISILSGIFIFMIWVSMRPDEVRFIDFDYFSFGMLLFMHFTMNLVPDYLSLLETRYLIFFMGRFDSVIMNFTLILVDLLITGLIPFIMFFIFTFIMGVMLPVLLKTVTPIYFEQILTLSNGATISYLGWPSWQISFYTSYFTSVWVLLYGLSGFFGQIDKKSR